MTISEQTMSDQDFNPFDTNAPSSDAFTVSSSKSWFERIVDGFKGILFGLLLIIAAGFLLFWNEGRAARTAAALSEGAGAVITVAADRIDPANEGKLVHVAGDTSAPQAARDGDFGFEAKALKLVRKVEMYQWKEESHSETQKKLGGGEETITRYVYSREWADRAIDSSRFRETSGHRNPAMPAVASREFAAPNARLGAFALGDRVIGLLDASEPFSAPDGAAAAARGRFGDRAKIAAGGVYVGANPDAPAIGDVRVAWTALPLTPLSVVARQTQSTFSPWTARNGNEILLVEKGVLDPALMFKHGQDENRVMTWILRALGLLMMFIGFRLAMSLLEVIADVVPFIGNIIGAGASLIALVCTLTLAPVIIAVAWLFYRPLVTIIALAVGAALVYGVRELAKRRHAMRASVAPPASPNPSPATNATGAATAPPQWGLGPRK